MLSLSLVAALTAAADPAPQQSLQPDTQEGANDVPAWELHIAGRLPPVYYINLPAKTDRKEHMEKVLATVPTTKVTRVEGVTKEDVEANLANGNLTLGDGLTLLDAGSTEYGPHIWGAYKASEYACTGSHLKAIQMAYDAGDQLALIVEDDVSFQHLVHWDSTIQEIVHGAPTDWEVLQLHTNNPTFYLEQGLQLASEKMRSDEKADSCGSGSGDEMYVRYRVGHWSTAAYLVNRFGMRALLEQTASGKKINEPAAADELLFMLVNAYTLQRPLFTTADFGSDVNKGAADDDDGTDGPTNALINEFYGLRQQHRLTLSDEARESARRTCTPRRSQRLSVAIITTTTTKPEDLRRATRNARALGPMERVTWTYAINSIDNQEALWTPLRPAFARAGVHLVAMDSGRQIPRLMPKLLGQLALLDHLDTLMPLDYLWMMDGDISFAPTNLPSIVNALITYPMPIISQPTIRLQDAADAANKSAAANTAQGGRGAGGQWFSPLNDQENNTICVKALWSSFTRARHVSALQVGSTGEDDTPAHVKLATNVYVARKLPLPAIESQAPLVAADFLRWYKPTLTRVAALQDQYAVDWGSDSMWCSGAKRFLKQGSPGIDRLNLLARPDPTRPPSPFNSANATAGTQRDPCVLFADIAVAHEDTRTIQQNEDFVRAGKELTARLEREERDYLSDDALNKWWEQHADCNKLVQRRNAIGDYRRFIRTDEEFVSHSGAKAFEVVDEDEDDADAEDEDATPAPAPVVGSTRRRARQEAGLR